MVSSGMRNDTDVRYNERERDDDYFIRWSLRALLSDSPKQIVNRLYYIIDILACSVPMTVMSSVLKSSYWAVSIGCSSEVKYRSLVNRLNSPSIRMSSSKSTFHNIECFKKERVRIRPLLQSNRRFVSISIFQHNNTARPPYGRTRKTHLY